MNNINDLSRKTWKELSPKEDYINRDINNIV